MSSTLLRGKLPPNPARGPSRGRSKEVELVRFAMSDGILLLRVFVGLLLAAHGAQKLFAWFGGPGIEGTRGYLASLGYPRSTEMAWLAGGTELGGGILLVLGFLTPLASAAFIALFINAMWTAHAHVLWNHASPPGIEFPLTLATVTGVLALTGAGRLSFDHALGLPLWGWGWFAAAVLVGIAAGAAALIVRRPPTAAQVEQTARIDRDAAA